MKMLDKIGNPEIPHGRYVYVAPKGVCLLEIARIGTWPWLEKPKEKKPLDIVIEIS